MQKCCQCASKVIKDHCYRCGSGMCSKHQIKKEIKAKAVRSYVNICVPCYRYYKRKRES